MKRHVLFIQGGGSGAHREDMKLAASLQHALGTGFEVRFPKMPDEANPDYRRWQPSLAQELAALPEGAALVAHSLGGAFLLKHLCEENLEKKIAGLFLIATPFWGGAGWRYEGWEQVALPENFAAELPQGVPVFLYHGRDDATVPFAHLGLYAQKLPRATIRPLDGRGHQLNADLSEVAADLKALPS